MPENWLSKQTAGLPSMAPNPESDQNLMSEETRSPRKSRVRVLDNPTTINDDTNDNNDNEYNDTNEYNEIREMRPRRENRKIPSKYVDFV